MTEVQDYLYKLERLHGASKHRSEKRSVSHHEDFDQNEINAREFASANIHCLLPAIPMAEHAGIINTIAFNRAVAELDGNSFFLLDRITLSDPGSILTEAKQVPVIFCTFHFGSYRIINPLLMRRGFNYMLPVENKIYGTEKADYLKTHVNCQAYFNSTSQFLVVDAEQPTAALAMARKARSGWSLLAYIDGNTGVQGAARQDAKLLRISLLGQPIYARKGIAFLSHFLKLPIVPVTCEITGPLERRMTFHDKIEPYAGGEDRDAYCLRATEQLYAVLGDYLKSTPSQWLGWLDMQKYLDLEGYEDIEVADAQDVETESVGVAIDGNRLVFNHERFGFIIQNDQRVLLDKGSYRLLSLPDTIGAMLETCWEPVEISSLGNTEEHRHIIEQLVSLGMLSVIKHSYRPAAV